ncbi:MAG TPA: TetR family transcriptional regulator [Acidimicrobiales bacterium]|nr:TetR family transcriptional regulator [Acidimicrobiales bacterium]
MPDDQTTGLRERKKARTRAAIQSHALRLFRERGYDTTTVQQIIEEVEVSESTFFRYFATKADVVLSDEFDPVIVAAFREQPRELSVLQALRAAFAGAFGQMTDDDRAVQTDRMVLVLSVPELRAAMLDQFASAMGLLAEIIAERTGRSRNDVSVRTFAGAVVGAAMAAMFAIADDPSLGIAETLDRSMACLEEGLPL